MSVLGFMILPTVIIGLLPGLLGPGIALVEEVIGPLQALVVLLMILGAVRVVAIIARDVTENSAIKLLATAVLVISGLYVFLWFLGLGNAAAIGLRDVSFTSGPATVNIFIDLRIFAFIALIVAALKIMTPVFDLASSARQTEEDMS